MEEFLSANIGSSKGGIYLGGQLSYHTDELVHQKYILIVAKSLSNSRTIECVQI